MFSKADWVNAGLPEILLENMNNAFGFERIVELSKKQDFENYEHEIKFKAPENIISLITKEGLSYKGSFLEINTLFSDP